MPSAFGVPRSTVLHNFFTHDDLAAQRAFFAARPHLAPTPLHRCGSLARHLGVGELLVKDETARFGLNAFKAAGAMFAVSTLVERGDIRPGNTIVCASEGNHGRAVARAARDVGCAARVYMSHRVSPARVQAIESEGAQVVLVDGSYDDAVRTMAGEAAQRGWVVVSDTSWEGYTEIPWLIMLGYTRILDEIAETENRPGLFSTVRKIGPVDLSSSRRFDAIFVPAGVGGLLAAVACWCDLQYGSERPRVVAVEPASATCVQTSVRAGRPTAIPGPFDTTMGGLRCGEMSPSVFPAVSTLVDAFVGIEDAWSFEAMRLLARPAPPDAKVECGPSGAAALGGLLAILTEPALADVREALALTHARVAVIASEGVTDPGLFAEVLARD